MVGERNCGGCGQYTAWDNNVGNVVGESTGGMALRRGVPSDSTSACRTNHGRNSGASAYMWLGEDPLGTSGVPRKVNATGRERPIEGA